MYRVGVAVTILFLLIFSLQGQGPGKTPAYLLLYEKAEQLFSSETADERSDSIALSEYLKVINLLHNHAENRKILADCYYKSGILLMTKQELEKALDYFRIGITTITGNSLPDSLLFKPYLYAGSIQYDLNNPDSALLYYKKAEAILDQYVTLNETERLYNKLGVLYYETGDYGKSIGYFEKALSLVNENNPGKTFFIVNYRNNIAAALLKLGQYNKAIEIFTSLLQYHIAEDQLLNNLGNAYIEEKDYPSALAALSKIKHPGIEKFNSITKAYIRNRQPDSAGIFLEKALLAIRDKEKQAKRMDIGVYFKNSGDLQMLTRNYTDAIVDYQHSMLQLDPAFKDSSVYSNPLSFFGLQNFSLLFDVLVAKAAAFNILDSLQPGMHYLEHSLNGYISALALAAHIERTYFSDDARLFLKDKVSPATEEAVSVALHLFRKTGRKDYLARAFGFVENNKASVLQAGLQHLEISTIPGIPVNLVAAEKKYTAQIAKLGIQYGSTQDSLEQMALQRRTQELELGLDSIQEKLNENPVYHDLKFSGRTIGMDTLQHNLLQKGIVVLSYYYTREQLICFYISREEAGVTSVGLNSQLFSTISSLRNELENPGASSGNSLRAKSKILYSQLISPVLSKISSSKKLVVIPYNEIGYLPFEMLQDEEEKNLLLRKFDISYNYSANFLSSEQSGSTGSYAVLGMAPFSEEGNNELALPALVASGEEISDLPGKLYKGAAATKDQFEKESGSLPVIHLATHAVANDADPLGSFIEFYGVKRDSVNSHRLYEKEIYNLDLKNAGLVILSACETGDGRVVNGEGIISLSRAFSYAGCKSVITSLWKADDRATSFILKQLHHYLRKGYAKDAALRRAKLDYLENDDVEERYKTPAYWAHLVLVGDYQPLVSTTVSWWLWIIIPVIILLITVIVLKKRNRA